MAILDITEYKEQAGALGRTVLPAGQEPSMLNQQLPITISSQKSAAFNEQTNFVRVQTDAACRIVFGNEPTASSSSMRMPANATEYFGVKPGQKIAVITSM